MHNCKLTSDALIDLALGEMSPAQTSELLAELNECATCQAEYTTLKNTLHVSRQALPPHCRQKSFGPAYHVRLQDKLSRSFNPTTDLRSRCFASFTSRLWIALHTMATTSVRVPVPAALAMLLLAGIFFLSVRSREQEKVSTSNLLPSVETRTVTVPVIQEKVVTKVVYVPVKEKRRKGQTRALDRNNANNLARAGSEASMSLVGFKPTDQVKLKVIKGSYRDEK